jgi:hypothetical protein
MLHVTEPMGKSSSGRPSTIPSAAQNETTNHLHYYQLTVSESELHQTGLLGGGTFLAKASLPYSANSSSSATDRLWGGLEMIDKCRLLYSWLEVLLKMMEVECDRRSRQ